MSEQTPREISSELSDARTVLAAKDQVVTDIRRMSDGLRNNGPSGNSATSELEQRIRALDPGFRSPAPGMTLEQKLLYLEGEYTRALEEKQKAEGRIRELESRQQALTRDNEGVSEGTAMRLVPTLVVAGAVVSALESDAAEGPKPQAEKAGPRPTTPLVENENMSSAPPAPAPRPRTTALDRLKDPALHHRILSVALNAASARPDGFGLAARGAKMFLQTLENAA